MTQLLAALIVGVVVAAGVLLLDGPAWAAGGLGAIAALIVDTVD
jgi:hypothetical protein